MRRLTGRIKALNGQDSTYHTRDLLVYGIRNFARRPPSAVVDQRNFRWLTNVF